MARFICVYTNIDYIACHDSKPCTKICTKYVQSRLWLATVSKQSLQSEIIEGTVVQRLLWGEQGVVWYPCSACTTEIALAAPRAMLEQRKPDFLQHNHRCQTIFKRRADINKPHVLICYPDDGTIEAQEKKSTNHIYAVSACGHAQKETLEEGWK